jgi:hypothetical protein
MHISRAIDVPLPGFWKISPQIGAHPLRMRVEGNNMRDLKPHDRVFVDALINLAKIAKPDMGERREGDRVCNAYDAALTDNEGGQIVPTNWDKEGKKHRGDPEE